MVVGSYDRKLNKTSDPPKEYRAADAIAASAAKEKAAATAETTGKGKSGASPPAPTW